MRTHHQRGFWAWLGLVTTTLLLTAAQTPPAGAEAPHGAALVKRPAPALEITTLSGDPAGLGPGRGFIQILYFLGGDGTNSIRLAQEMQFFFERGHADKLRYLGVSTREAQALTAWARTNGIDHSLASDPDEAARRPYLGEQTGDAVFVIDHRGTVRFFWPGMASTLRGDLRVNLSGLIGDLERSVRSRPSVPLRWRTLPLVPAFRAKNLKGVLHTSEQYRGKPLVLYFFEQNCEFCPAASKEVSELFFRYKARGIQFLGVVSKDPEGTVRQEAIIKGLAFPILLDADKSIRRAFGSEASPDLFWIDAQGQVRWRELGAPDRLGEFLDLEARVLLGEADTDTLASDRYVGYRYCRVCHQAEFEDWLQTPHAVAMNSLNQSKNYTRPECTPCHVTGFGQPGGFGKLREPYMSHVQCESCHGMGGPHGAPGGDAPVSTVARCSTCHTPQFPLQESLEVSLAWMNHVDTPDAATLFADGATKMAELLRPRLVTVTFQRGTPYVGSEACAPCHGNLVRAWKAGPHGRALETLHGQGDGDTPACLACHTTAYGELTGFRHAESTPQLAGVGCESCHGPGGDHVNAAKGQFAATLYGLTSDCPTCRPEAFCGTCHDAENDPDFQMPQDLIGAIHPAP